MTVVHGAGWGARASGPKGRITLAGHTSAWAKWAAAILTTALISGCGGPLRDSMAEAKAARTPGSASPPLYLSAPGIRVPRPDFASPASVAASFFTAWASTDAVHDGPGASLARCVALVTPGLMHQLTASQPAPARWRTLRAERLVSLVLVVTVTRPAGSPPPGRTRVYLRVYAQRVTTTTAGRSVADDGITVQLVHRGNRWLVARLLFY